MGTTSLNEIPSNAMTDNGKATLDGSKNTAAGPGTFGTKESPNSDESKIEDSITLESSRAEVDAIDPITLLIPIAVSIDSSDDTDPDNTADADLSKSLPDESEDVVS